MKISQMFSFILIICFFSVTTISAQGLTTKGLKGGLSLASFIGSDASIGTVDPSMDVKFAVGGFLNFEVNEQFSIRPEAYYSSKGAKYEEGGDKLTFTMNYIDIPVLFVLKAGDNFGIFAGPQLGIYLNGKIKSDGASGDIESDNVTSPEFELVFGANYFFNQFHIDARYAMGISKIFDVSSNDDVRHGVIQILFGIAL